VHPKAILFPPAVQAGLIKDIISSCTSPNFNKLSAQLHESVVCLNTKLFIRRCNFALLFRLSVAHL